MAKLEYYDWISPHEKALKTIECNPCWNCGMAMHWREHDVKCPICHIGTIGFSNGGMAVEAWNRATNELNMRTKKTWYNGENVVSIEFEYLKPAKKQIFAPYEWKPVLAYALSLSALIVILLTFVFTCTTFLGLDTKFQNDLLVAGLTLFNVWFFVRLQEYSVVKS